MGKGSDMRDNARRMRPMGIADILDETVELYKTSFVVLIGIAAVLYVPYSIFNQYFTMKYLTHLDPMKQPSTGSLIALLGGIILSVLWLVVASPFVTGAMTYAISERYLGRRATIGASFKRVFSAAIFFRIVVAILITLGVAMVAYVIIVAAVIGCVPIGSWRTSLLWAAIPLAAVVSLAAVVGAGYVLLRLALINCVIVVESATFSECIGRAWNMMTGFMLKCLGILALTWTVVTIVSYLLLQPTQSLMTLGILKGGQAAEWILVLHTLIAALVSTVSAPVTSIVTILLYYDIRIRKEGFDLELLANELHARSRQPGMTPQALPQEQTASLPQEQKPPEGGRNVQ